MGVPAFDFSTVLVFVLVVGVLLGAVGLALFVWLPLSWGFYAGLAAGVVSCALCGVAKRAFLVEC